MTDSTVANWLLILLTLGVVAGVGVLVVSRVRASKGTGNVTEATNATVVTDTEPRTVETRTDEAIDEVVADPVVADPVEIDADTDTDTEVVEDHAPGVARASEKTKSLFSKAFATLRGRGKVDETTWDELEETLLRADIGIGVTTSLLDPLRQEAKSAHMTSPDEVIAALRDRMTAALSDRDRNLRIDSERGPSVWLFVGVNGVGKTTTIGKVATAEGARGRSVLLAAGDTFRAAAAEQLQIWAERSGAGFVRGSEGGDPASVIFDGIQSASAKGVELVLGDTAGRLQNKANLMEELKKVRRVADKAEGTVTEVLLVIDATTGQNGLSQAREFAAATDVTGVVLTKLDGSAKGGIVFAIETELGIPVKLVGVGEGAADLMPFDPAEFISALFDGS